METKTLIPNNVATACVQSITAVGYDYASHILVPFFAGLTAKEAQDVLAHLGRWVEKSAGGDWPECPALDDLDVVED